MTNQNRRITIVGAGASGLIAAEFAARAGASVTLLERLGKPGRKILATGGGRCNVSNLANDEQFAAAFGPRGQFTRPALRQFGHHELRSFFEERGTRIVAPDGFHLYPMSNRAADVFAPLLDECRKAGVDIRCDTTVLDLIIEDAAVRGVATESGRIEADAVIVAAGGKSYPELGSDGSGFTLANKAGHRIVEPVPALVGLSIRESWCAELSGVSLPQTTLRLEGGTGRKKVVSMGSMLFTHRGISGPAALDISGAVARKLLESEKVYIDVSLVSSMDSNAWFGHMESWRGSDGGKPVPLLLSRVLPKAVVATVCRLTATTETRAGELTRQDRERLIGALTSLRLAANGTEGFAKAMVTSGGVDLRQVNSSTLMSRVVSNLYFCGEVLDLDGLCGGYNLQWAFSSGALAGRNAAGEKNNYGSVGGIEIP